MLIDGEGKKIIATETIIPWAQWQKERVPLHLQNQTTVLVFPHDEDILQLQQDLACFKEIILTFPLFKDGRAYSQARLLREELGFQGHLRASGDIGEDQIAFMRRCGFDRFEIADDSKADWKKALKGFSFDYQPTGSKTQTVWERRRGDK